MTFMDGFMFGLGRVMAELLIGVACLVIIGLIYVAFIWLEKK